MAGVNHAPAVAPIVSTNEEADTTISGPVCTLSRRLERDD